MMEEIEIEFKNLLTVDEYVQLINAFTIERSALYKQANHYFDTPHFHLKEQQCALRIRAKNGGYILTLKEPHIEGLLETHQMITESEAKQTFRSCNLPPGNVTTKLKLRLGEDLTKLVYLGELKTDRIEVKIKDGLLVFDKSNYLGYTDYELEFECSDWMKGKTFFENFLNRYHIPKRDTPNKIQRFMNQKNALGGAK